MAKDSAMSKLEATQLKKDKIKITTKEIEDEVWPEITVHAYVKASPIEAAAIFAAFDYQKIYVPNLLESKVTKEVFEANSNKINVKYTMDMPWPISDSDYINGHTLSQGPEQNSYTVQWYKVESESAEDLNGSASFLAYPELEEGEVATLMIYKAHVTPESFLAGVLKKFMIKDVRSSVEATVEETEKLKKNKSKILKKYVDIFRDILSGKAAYLLKS